MSTTQRFSSASSRAVRAEIGHPVIDADGHLLELQPLLEDRFFELAKDLAGGETAAALAHRDGLFYDRRVQARAEALGAEGRRRQGVNRPPFWSQPADALDRATGYLPRLLHERLDELGIDFAILFPSRALPMVSIPEAELRRLAIRALNVHHAQLYAEFSRRLRPVAVIPTHTPAEAIAELEFAAGELGAKTALLNGIVHRPLETGGTRLDTLAMDSEHDYEPLWRKLVELRVAPVFHASGQGWGSRRSPSSYVYNHIGSFAAAGEAICKSLFLGGVTRRHPALSFALMEGGVGWACNLWADLVSHFEKRNADAIHRLDPASLDRAELRRLIERHGDARTCAALPRIEAWIAAGEKPPDPLDEFAALGCSYRASTSAARRTTRSSPGPSARARTRAAPCCARCSAPTSATGTCRR
jgi:predicted TIM-barrel fold metal-dependent hydrolase